MDESVAGFEALEKTVLEVKSSSRLIEAEGEATEEAGPVVA